MCRPQVCSTGYSAHSANMITYFGELQVQRHQLRQAVQCLAHTILFCRSLGTVRPQPVECPALNSSYMSCGDPGVATVVEDGASAVERWADKVRDAIRRASSHSFTSKFEALVLCIHTAIFNLIYEL